MSFTIDRRKPHTRNTTETRYHPAKRRWRGNTLVEVMVSFAILGIGLAGMCRVVVMQIRQVRVLENRLQGNVVQHHWSSGTNTTMLPGQTYYLVPWQSRWTQKLAGAAQIVAGSYPIPGDPVFTLNGQATASYAVNIEALSALDNDQIVTATVSLVQP
jgi:type II secretory pathway pseudopilin PulG